ncbi:unnamed protein product [Cyclocybe aegerita]|uniref:Uncharacterized protein n=1 Tax=Cyclocybe aegerita TaxID=1973307 RepID=A0A8S0XI20_CYCAE|nr:unnamed protein product [Cyclocybe aegerita]
MQHSATTAHNLHSDLASLTPTAPSPPTAPCGDGPAPKGDQDTLYPRDARSKPTGHILKLIEGSGGRFPGIGVDDGRPTRRVAENVCMEAAYGVLDDDDGSDKCLDG